MLTVHYFVPESPNGDSKDECFETFEVCIGDTGVFVGFRTGFYTESNAKYLPRVTGYT